MSASPADPKPEPTDGVVESERVFDAPRESVFRAFSDPTVLAQWWGPNGFSNTFHEFDFRPGGAWRFLMHGPDGSEFVMEKRFLDIRPPELITLEHLSPIHRFLMTSTFTEEGNGTRVSWRMEFASAEDLEAIRPFVLEANEQNFDRLEAWARVTLVRRVVAEGTDKNEVMNWRMCAVVGCALSAEILAVDTLYWARTRANSEPARFRGFEWAIESDAVVFLLVPALTALVVGWLLSRRLPSRRIRSYIAGAWLSFLAFNVAMFIALNKWGV